MRTPEALRQLLTHLAAVADDEAGQRAEDQADDILAHIIANRSSAGRIMLALASFLVHTWTEEEPGVSPAQAIEILTTGGEPIDGFKEFLEAAVAAHLAGERLNDRSIFLAAKITLAPVDASIVLWVMATYLASAAPQGKDQFAEFVDAFVASCVRQELILDDELTAPPIDPTPPA